MVFFARLFGAYNSHFLCIKLRKQNMQLKCPIDVNGNTRQWGTWCVLLSAMLMRYLTRWKRCAFPSVIYVVKSAWSRKPRLCLIFLPCIMWRIFPWWKIHLVTPALHSLHLCTESQYTPLRAWCFKILIYSLNTFKILIYSLNTFPILTSQGG